METLIDQGTEVLIRVLVTVILTMVAYGLRLGLAKLRDWLGNSHYETALSIARDLIQAAEQRGLTSELWKVGKNKKVWVLDQLQAELDRQKIRIDVDRLDAMIEAEILRQFNWDKLEPEQKQISALPGYAPGEAPTMPVNRNKRHAVS